MIAYTSGNIFETEAEAIVIPTNCDGIMGAGLAAQCRRIYPAVFSIYRMSRLEIGHVVGCWIPVHERPPETHISTIYCLHTKYHWRERARIEYISAGLFDLSTSIERTGIASVAIPKLGCGLGDLNWNDVRPLIEREFRHRDNLDVWIYE